MGDLPKGRLFGACYLVLAARSAVGGRGTLCMGWSGSRKAPWTVHKRECWD